VRQAISLFPLSTLIPEMGHFLRSYYTLCLYRLDEAK
jgi:hypothetical protein